MKKNTTIQFDCEKLFNNEKNTTLLKFINSDEVLDHFIQGVPNQLFPIPRLDDNGFLRHVLYQVAIILYCWFTGQMDGSTKDKFLDSTNHSCSHLLNFNFLLKSSNGNYYACLADTSQNEWGEDQWSIFDELVQTYNLTQWVQNFEAYVRTQRKGREILPFGNTTDLERYRHKLYDEIIDMYILFTTNKNLI